LLDDLLEYENELNNELKLKIMNYKNSYIRVFISQLPDGMDIDIDTWIRITFILFKINNIESIFKKHNDIYNIYQNFIKKDEKKQ
jgi:hypothetical protein